MLQIFYKEKPIIISDKKSDLKNSLIIDPKLVKNLYLTKLLTKKKKDSIGVFYNDLDLRMIKQGIYIVKLFNNNKQLFSEKIAF